MDEKALDWKCTRCSARSLECNYSEALPMVVQMGAGDALIPWPEVAQSSEVSSPVKATPFLDYDFDSMCCGMTVARILRFHEMTSF